MSFLSSLLRRKPKTQEALDAEQALSEGEVKEESAGKNFDNVQKPENGFGFSMPTTHRVLDFGRTPKQPAEEKLISSNDKLALFRRLTGIDSAASLNKASVIHRPGINVGIYGRVVRSQNKAATNFKVGSILINACLGLQLVVAAALTALGAANGNHGAVTVFGGLNTVIAGFLTYLKGSGLPNRLRYYESEWSKVREYIEQREREFGRLDCDLDPIYESRVIEAMYETVRCDVEANIPDTYVSVTRPPNMGIANVGKMMPPASVVNSPVGEKAIDVLQGGAGSSSATMASTMLTKAGTEVKEITESEKAKIGARVKASEQELMAQERRAEEELVTRERRAEEEGRRKGEQLAKDVISRALG